MPLYKLKFYKHWTALLAQASFNARAWHHSNPFLLQKIAKCKQVKLHHISSNPKNEITLISLQKKQDQVQKGAYRLQIAGNKYGHNNYQQMSSEDTAKQISKLTYLIQKLTQKFDKYFKPKPRKASEQSESQKSKKETQEFASSQHLDIAKEEISKDNSPRKRKPRKHQDLKVQDYVDEIRSEQARDDTANTILDKTNRKREEKETVADRPPQQQPANININFTTNHDSSNHHNNQQPHPPPPPCPAQPEVPQIGRNTNPVSPAQQVIEQDPNPAPPLNNGFFQTYPYYRNNTNTGNRVNPIPQQQITGLDARSCLLLLFGLLKLLGGIAMVVYGSIQLARYSSTNSTYCPSPYSYSGGQCCYNYNYYYNYSYCYWPNTTQGSTTTGIVLVSVGSFSLIVGIALLVQSCRVFNNNNHVIFCSECC